MKGTKQGLHIIMSKSITSLDSKLSRLSMLASFFWMALGSCLAAFAIQIFFLHNNLIDGGTVGLAMIVGRVIGSHWIPWLTLVFTLPFVYLAYRAIGKTFILYMIYSTITFSIFLGIIPFFFPTPFIGEALEVVVIGGALLGTGIGLIIRSGGCLDGTEILGLLSSKRWGFTVGQVVFFCNIGVYALAGIVFNDWHPAILSLIAYVVVVKIMDFVLVGLDETKAVLVVSRKYNQIQEAILHKLGLGITILYGRGGFSKEPLEVLYVIVERLQLAELKELVHGIDPKAFIAITNLHEVASINGKKGFKKHIKRRGLAIQDIFLEKTKIHISPPDHL